jgi:hypothetical protein
MGFMRHEPNPNDRVTVRSKAPRLPGAPAPCPPSWAKLDPAMADKLLPDGRTLQSVPPAELRRVLAVLGVPVAAGAGYADTAAAYVTHLEAIALRAGQTAVTAWLEARRAVG